MVYQLSMKHLSISLKEAESGPIPDAWGATKEK